MATQKTKYPSRKSSAAAPTTRKAAARKRSQTGRIGHDELAQMAEPTLAKVAVSSKIDPVLAREVDLLLRGSPETLSQFVAAAVENEYHRRKGTRRAKEMTLADLAKQIEEVKSSLAGLGEFNLAESRETKALARLIGQAVGVFAASESYHNSNR